MVRIAGAAVAVSLSMSAAQAQEAVCASEKMPVQDAQNLVDDMGAELIGMTPMTPRGMWFLFKKPSGAFFDVWVDLEGMACISQTYIGDPRQPGASL